MSSKGNSSSIGLSGILFIIFLTLKLTGNIDWSWWWVTSPLWIPVMIFFGFLVFILLLIVILLIFGVSIDDITNKIEAFRKTLKN